MTPDREDASPASAADGGSASAEPGRMLARTWTIAATTREPAAYGIPDAPRFPAERRPDGGLALYGPDRDDLLATAADPSPVRR
jgi:hypothetical protein